MQSGDTSMGDLGSATSSDLIKALESAYASLNLLHFNNGQLTAELKAANDHIDYLKTYVIPEKDKHGRMWHDLAQERLAKLSDAEATVRRLEDRARYDQR